MNGVQTQTSTLPSPTFFPPPKTTETRTRTRLTKTIASTIVFQTFFYVYITLSSTSSHFVFACIQYIFFVSLPLCGYISVKVKNRQLILWFSVTNLVVGIIAFIVFTQFYKRYNDHDAQLDATEDKDELMGEMMISLIVTIYSILSFWLGFELYSNQQFDVSVRPIYYSGGAIVDMQPQIMIQQHEPLEFQEQFRMQQPLQIMNQQHEPSLLNFNHGFQEQLRIQGFGNNDVLPIADTYVVDEDAREQEQSQRDKGTVAEN